MQRLAWAQAKLVKKTLPDSKICVTQNDDNECLN